MSELATRLINHAIRTKKKTLDLGYCGLDGTEERLNLLAKCKQVKKLVLSNQWLEMGAWKEKKSKNSFRENILKKLPLVLPPNLEELIISGEYYKRWQFEDYSPIASLQNLQTLYLSFHEIKDISFLKHLNKLENLYLEGNLIQDIKPLKKLEQLKLLSLYDNPIRNISALRTLKNLKILGINFMELSYFPIAFVKLQFFRGKLSDYLHLTELPEIEKVWQIMQTKDKENINLAYQLALSQGWTEEEFEMYKKLL